MKTGTVRQILLITDGCSNYGEDPVTMAALAKELGITVNVIGVMENDVIEERGVREIEEIALQGGGVSEIVYARSLSQTVQMVTRKAMTQTLQGVVNKELKQILGNDAGLESLPPDKRGEVLEVVEELNETVDLEILILVDTSASMKNKLPTVKEALLDLSLSLNARTGNNHFSLFVFPGKRSEVEKLLDWTPKLETLTSVFSKLTPGGMTPTGPAIKAATAYFGRNKAAELFNDEEGYYKESV